MRVKWNQLCMHFEYTLMRRADSFENTLMLGKIEGRRRRGWQRMDSGSWWWTERPGVLRLMGSQRVGHDWVTKLNCKELTHLKVADAGKDWSQEEKGMTEHEMVGWHHWLNGHEFEQALGFVYGQGSMAYCSSCGHKKSDLRSDWTELIWLVRI